MLGDAVFHNATCDGEDAKQQATMRSNDVGSRWSPSSNPTGTQPSILCNVVSSHQYSIERWVLRNMGTNLITCRDAKQRVATHRRNSTVGSMQSNNQRRAQQKQFKLGTMLYLLLRVGNPTFARVGTSCDALWDGCVVACVELGSPSRRHVINASSQPLPCRRNTS